jgi:hypothetical protein
MKKIAWSGQIAVLLLAISTVGYRVDVLPFRLALFLLVVGLLVCTLVALVEFWVLSVTAINKKPLRLEYLVLAVACAIGPGLSLYIVGIEGFRAPRIHDITTDTVNPPAFRFTRVDEGFRENCLTYGMGATSSVLTS